MQGPVGGTSVPIDRHSTAKMLGFDGLIENSLDATSTRDFVAEYVAMISILMTNLSRISEDFVIWSTSEFSFIGTFRRIYVSFKCYASKKES